MAETVGMSSIEAFLCVRRNTSASPRGPTVRFGNSVPPRGSGQIEDSAMPTYDYYCPTLDRTVEVIHPFSVTLSTWGELCERAGVDPGSAPRETPVERVLPRDGLWVTASAPAPSSESTSSRPAPRSGGGCGGHCSCH
jgi:hypothetical protein